MNLKASLALLSLAVHLSFAHAAGDAIAGKTVFYKCAACHQIGPAANNGIGPKLNDISGKAAAGTGGFSYSPAMKKSGIVWTDDNLRSFLQDPAKFVPGTSMGFPGIKNDNDLSNLLAYLNSSN